MKGKNYKIVSLYSFFPFQEKFILDLKNKLLEIENEKDFEKALGKSATDSDSCLRASKSGFRSIEPLRLPPR